MRFTIVDQSGSISFGFDARVLDAVVAACARDPLSVEALLEQVDAYDKRVRDYVLSGMSVFDEHNSRENLMAVHAILQETRSDRVPPFRVLDELTRQGSLQPARAGLVIFNLRSRRIVQVQNSYREVGRSGAVQIHDGERWTRQARRYEIPESWSIVP